MLLKPGVVGADSGSNRLDVEEEESVPQGNAGHGSSVGRRHCL